MISFPCLVQLERTLGMCIGFSFTGVISLLINILQYGISKLISHNDTMKIETNNIEGKRDFTSNNSAINKYFDSKVEEYQKGFRKLEEKLNAELEENRLLKKLVEENSKKMERLEMLCLYTSKEDCLTSAAYKQVQ